MCPSTLSEHLASFPKLELGHTPTPLTELRRLSDHLGGPRIWMKRDDCTGLAFGGNKVRKLEYILGKALRDGIDTVVTVGAIQSNHVRQSAAAAAIANLQCEAVIVEAVDKDGWNANQSGNVMLDHLLGANIHRLGRKADPYAYIGKLMADLVASKRRPLMIPLGGSEALGSLGYVAMVGELTNQIADYDALYLASSTGGTQAGILAAQALLQRDAVIQGITVYNPDTAAFASEIENLGNDTLELLGFEGDISSDNVLVDNNYLGNGYGISTGASREAIKLVARLEAIFLDPVYSAKAMAALIDHIEKGQIGNRQNVIFLHTGGTPGLFAYADEFSTSSAQ